MERSLFGRIGAVALLATRGVLLWFVVPFGFLAWLLTAQWALTPRVSLGAFLGWLDWNLAVMLVRGPFEAAFPNVTIEWMPARDRGRVLHRIGAGDLL